MIVEGTARAARSLNNISPVAGKTGTTNDYTDAWFAGYSPYLTTVVWVGRDNNMTIGNGESGSKAALPIWSDYMSDALIKYPHNEFTRPGKIEFVNTTMGRIALKRENSNRDVYDSYFSKSYKNTKIDKNTQKPVKKMKDIKEILKNAFLLPNP